jgi:NitT/TauT family transport system substrate-binding protein
MRTRGRIVAAAVAALGLALTAACGGGGDSGGGSTEKVVVSLVPGIPANVPIIIGQEQGMFAAHGVDVELMAMPTGVTSSQVLLSGTANYSTTLVASMAQAFQQNQHLSYNCGVQLVNPTSILAPKGSGLPSTASGADWQQIATALKGSTIGLPVPVGTTLQYVRDEAFREVGVDPAGLTYVNTGGGASLLGALTGRSVTVADAQTPSTEGLSTGPAAAAEELIYMPEDGPDLYREYGTGYVASRDWLEKNPEASGRFCAAMTDVMAWIDDPANSAAFQQSIVKVSGELGSEALGKTESRLRDVFSVDMPRDSVEAALETTKKLPGVLKPDLPVPTLDDLLYQSPAPTT